MTPTQLAAASRPRVSGERELEILLATMEVLSEVGYDRLTMDAVAAKAHASKATLYRRWSTKVSLVIEALQCIKGHEDDADSDTGTLRGDLQALFCAPEGAFDAQSVATFSAVLTAVHRDTEFAEAFRRDVLGPKIARSQAVWKRARARGEIADDVDITLLEPALAGIVMHRVFVMGEVPDEDLVTRVIDQIILPAATREPLPLTSPHTSKES